MTKMIYKYPILQLELFFKWIAKIRERNLGTFNFKLTRFCALCCKVSKFNNSDNLRYSMSLTRKSRSLRYESDGNPCADLTPRSTHAEIALFTYSPTDLKGFSGWSKLDSERINLRRLMFSNPYLVALLRIFEKDFMFEPLL